MKKRIQAKSQKVEIEIEDGLKKTYTLFEVRPYDVKAIFDDISDNTDLTNFLSKTLELCSDVTHEDLKLLYPSDMEKLYEAFKTLNRPLWKFSQFWKIHEIIKALLLKTVGPQVLLKAQKELQNKFAGLSETATKTPVTTGGDSLQ